MNDPKKLPDVSSENEKAVYGIRGAFRQCVGAVAEWMSALLDFLLPRLCPGCGRRLVKGEGLVCPRCLMELTLEWDYDWLTNPYMNEWNSHACLKHVGALARYRKKGIVARIVHQLKYHRRYELGRWMGQLAVRELQPTGLFDGVDVLVPIPLTRSRRNWRGFNQAEMIAEGIAEELGIEVRTDILVRTLDRESQTHFTHDRRRGNMQGVFALASGANVRGLHLMLVDDVMTTGATMLSALQTLEQQPDVQLSAFAWAWARIH